MIKKRYFLPLLAALALSSCSSEDNVINDEPENNNPGYLAVNIVQPKSVGSRADAEDQFEDGTEEENSASEGLFFIFTDKNNSAQATLVNAAQRLPLVRQTPGTSNKPQIEAMYQAVLVITGQKTEPTGIQIVCVLNAPAGMEDGVTTLADLEAKIADYSSTGKNQFVMSNSVYKATAEGEKILGTKVTQAYKTELEARANPVDIYVERVVAKIRAKFGGSFNNQGASIYVDGLPTTLKIVVKGVTIANIVADKAYLFKNINGFGTGSDDFASWVWNPDNKRSYWETMPNEELKFKNKSYKLTNLGTGEYLFNEYVLPNTSDTKTCVMLTAQLQDNDGNAFEFVSINGIYYKTETALSLIANAAKNAGYRKKTGENTYETLAPSDFEWKDNAALVKDLGDAATDADKAAVKIGHLKDYEQVARVKAGVTVCILGADNKVVEPSEATPNQYKDALHTLLAGSETARPYVGRYYKDGMCYYFVEIDHTPVAADRGYTGTKEFKGVVRNHIYDLTLNSIKGVGTNVFDPEQIIIPQKPDEDELWYLAAKINVLSWRIVNQNVDFQGK